MKKMKMQVVNHLFKVDNACIKLRKGYNIIFHLLVTKLLFFRKQERPDIQPGITFLTTRVKNPDKDDWKKLRSVLSNLDAKINTMKLQLNSNNPNVIDWWVEASYGTYIDLKQQTGATISIRKGCVTSAQKNRQSTRQVQQ